MPHIRTLDLQISPVSSVVTVAIRRDSILQNHRLTINTDGKGCVLISVKRNVRYDRCGFIWDLEAEMKHFKETGEWR